MPDKPQKQQSNPTQLQKIFKVEESLHKALGRNFFFFIFSTSDDALFADEVRILDQRLTKAYKNPRKKKLIHDYITAVGDLVRGQIKDPKQKSKPNYPPIPLPWLLEFEKKNMQKLTFDFLYAQHVLHQIRWIEALPDFAMYAIEFFIPPLEENQKRGFDESDFKMEQTMNIDLPFGLELDEQGNFDLALTNKNEAKYHLIKSKLSLLGSMETKSGYLYHIISNFPERGFFVFNFEKELKLISELLVQVAHDTVTAFAYQQIRRGVPQKEARRNAQAFLQKFVQDKKLEEIIVFRSLEEDPLEMFLLKLLESIMINNPHLKEETIKDVYTHIMQSFAKFILQGYIIPGNFYVTDTRKATEGEKELAGNEYTLTVSLIQNNGIVMKDIKEYYQIRLADRSTKALIVAATGSLEQGQYFA